MTAKLSPARKFFLRHAGYSWNPATETRSEGRARCAQALADAETWARDNEVWFRWEDDFECHSHIVEFDSYDQEPCKSCTAFDADGEVLASVGCIDDATPEYRRVIEAELALGLEKS